MRRRWSRRRLLALLAGAIVVLIGVAYGAFVLVSGGGEPRLALDARPGGIRDIDGDYTLHRVTRRVRIPFQAVVHGAQLVVVGAFRIRFSDYGFQPPKRPIVSIRPTGLIEFRLVFTRTT